MSADLKPDASKIDQRKAKGDARTSKQVAKANIREWWIEKYSSMCLVKSATFLSHK